MPRLGNCPFCGKSVKIGTDREYYERVQPEGRECIYIECKCGCQLWHFDTDGKDYDTAVEEAADKWNRRTFYV